MDNTTDPAYLVRKESQAISLTDARQAYVEAIHTEQIKDGSAYLLIQLNRMLQACADSRRPYMKNMALNRSYFIGEQDVRYLDVKEGRVVRNTKIPLDKIVVANYIAKYIRTQAGMLLGGALSYEVHPPSLSSEDKIHAKTSKALLRYYLSPSVINYDFVRMLCNIAVCTDGVVFQKAFWDKGYGKLEPITQQVMQSFPDPVTGEIVQQPQTITKRDVKGQVEYERTGRATIEVVPAHFLFWPPGAKTVGTSAYVFESRRRTLKYVREVWPDKGWAVLGDTETGDMDSMSTSQVHAIAQDSSTCTVTEYWEIPSPTRPSGRYAVFTPRVVLHDGNLPYKHLIDGPQHLPYVAQTDTPLDNTIYAKARTTDARPIQDTINQMLTKMKRWIRQCENPGWIAEEGALTVKPKNGPGDVVTYRRGFREPQRQTPPPPPLTTVRQLEQAIVMMGDVWGMHPASQGTVPQGGGRLSGIALAELAGRDDKDLIPANLSITAATRSVLLQLLGLVHQFQKDGDVGTIVGENKQIEVISWKRGPTPAPCDIEVQPVIGNSKETRMAQLQLATTMGLWQMPPDIQRSIMKVLRIGSMEDYGSEITQHEDKQQREILAMRGHLIEGQAPTYVPTVPWDNDQIHMKECETFMNSAAFESEPVEVQEFIVQHQQEHEQKHNEMMIKQMMFQQGQMSDDLAPQPPGGKDAGTAKKSQSASQTQKS